MRHTYNLFNGTSHAIVQVQESAPTGIQSFYLEVIEIALVSVPLCLAVGHSLLRKECIRVPARLRVLGAAWYRTHVDS